MVPKILKLTLRHKFVSGIMLLIVIGVGYFGYTKIFSNDGVIRYATTQAQIGTLIVSVSGSGQVSVVNQIDLKPKALGDIAYVGVINGQEVKAGALISQIDAKDAQKAVRDAEANLESARISLEKIKKPADELSVLQAENSLAQAKESKNRAEDDLEKAYEDGFNNVANGFLDLPSVISGLKDMLFSSTMGNGSQWNIDYYADAVKDYDRKSLQYKQNTYAAYNAGREAYDQNFADYKSASRFSASAEIEALIDETYDTTKNIAEAIKESNNLIQFYRDKLIEENLKPNPLSETHLSSITSHTGKTNAHLLNLLSVRRSIETNKEAIVNAERAIAEKTAALAKLKAGAEDLDIKSAELSVKQRENALLDAKEKLADYFVRAPFDGIIANFDAKKGDAASSATILGTLITKQKIAEISLNEVDAAKIAVGQKVTLTFDAIADLAISGRVAEVDTVGSVSQGVVTYAVKVAFDAQDERVKPGMSVSAGIITEAKMNVLLIPNSALKQQGGQSYVEMPDSADANAALASASGAVFQNDLSRKNVSIGSANDEFTEITEGLDANDLIVTRIIQPSSATQPSTQNSTFRFPGTPGSGGGARGGNISR